MPLVELNLAPTRVQLSRFAAIGLPIAGSLAAAFAWSRGSLSAALACLALAAVALIVGRTRPEWFRPLFIASSAITWPAAWLFGWLLLAGVYYLLITPIGLILRLVRRDPLARGFDREAQSYWVAQPDTSDRDRYLRQY